MNQIKRNWHKKLALWLGIIVSIAGIVVAIIINCPRPEFIMKIDTLEGIVEKGGTIEVEIKVEHVSGYSEPVALSAIKMPTDVKANIHPRKNIPAFTSKMNIYVGLNAPEGNHEITIRGISGDGIVKNCIYELTIIAPPPPPPPEPEIVIGYPGDTDFVRLRQTVRGTSQNIPEEQAIWIIVYPHGFNRYHPCDKPALLEATGNWFSEAFIGIEDDAGMMFDLIAVIADKSAQDKFKDYLRRAAQNVDWPGMEKLPEGATIHDRVTVTRQ